MLFEIDRNLSAEEIEISNLVKGNAKKMSDLIDTLIEHRIDQLERIEAEESPSKIEGLSSEEIESSLDYIELARANLQQGLMWLNQAIELPDTF